MNPTIRNLPGHVYAPGYQPQGPSPLETGIDRVVGVLGDLTDLAVPFLVALSGALLVWVIAETLRTRKRARQRAAAVKPFALRPEAGGTAPVSPRRASPSTPPPSTPPPSTPPPSTPPPSTPSRRAVDPRDAEGAGGLVIPRRPVLARAPVDGLPDGGRRLSR